jgi:hypothetical protein
MSGTNINLKYQHRDMPLIGALGRSVSLFFGME